MARKKISSVFLLFALFQPNAAWSKSFEAFHGVDICTDDEEWTLPGGIPREPEIETSASDIDLERLGEVYKAEAKATDAGVKDYFKYMVGRDYFSAGLIHLANEKFEKIVQSSAYKRSPGVWVAALECMNKIQISNKAFTFSRKTQKSILRFSATEVPAKYRNPLRRAALGFVRAKAVDGFKPSEKKRLAKMLSGNPAYEPFTLGLIEVASDRADRVIKHMEKFLKIDVDELPEDLRGNVEMAKMALARAYFEKKKFKQSIATYETIDKNSNFIIDSIVEKTWAQFRSKDYSSALGSAIGLHMGDFKRAFHPDSEMLITTGYFEICQLNEAKRMIKVFTRNYYKTNKWLKAWRSDRKKRNLYEEMLSALSTRKETVPAHVLTEWVRSPVFSAYQEEVNLIHKERESLVDVFDGVKTVNRSLASDQSVVAGAKLAHVELTKYRKRLTSLESRAVAKIQSALTGINLFMIEHLKDRISNLMLLRAEILGDLGNKNLGKKKMTSQEAPGGDDVWDWGEAEMGKGSENAEVWQDEIGIARADLPNICVRGKDSVAK